MSKTNFQYEVMVHDDASTDRTEEILREYKKEYSDIIRVFYEEGNQHCQGKLLRAITLIAENELKGKYVVLCNGDNL